MKKFQLLVALCFATAISLTSVECAYQKVPVIEKFTNTGCSPCAYYNKEGGYTNFARTYSNKVVHITYHAAWPDPNDPFYSFNSKLSNSKIDYYNNFGEQEAVEGVPTVKLNGSTVEDGMPEVNTLKQIVDTDLNNKSPMLIVPKMTIDNDNEVKVTVNIKSDQEMKDVLLRVLILEAEVWFDEAANGEKEFLYVARYSLADTMPAFSINANGEQNFTFTQKIDDDELNKEQLYAIAFVQNQGNSHEIVQAGITHKFFTEPLIVELHQDNVYSDEKVALNSMISHNVEIINKSNFNIVVNLDYKKVTDIDEETGWEYNSKLNTSFILEPNGKNAWDYMISYTGTKPSCALSGYNIVIKRDGEPKPNVIYPKQITEVVYVDVTKNTQYVYISDGIVGDPDEVIKDFNKAAYFKNELVNIPAYNKNLFTSKILDSMKFVGLTLDDETMDCFLDYGKYIFPKISTITNNGGKLFLSAPAQFAMAAEEAEYDAVLAKLITDFYKTQFDVSSKDANFIELIDTSGEVVSKEIKGVNNDPISKGITDTLNIEFPQTELYCMYVDMYDIDDTTKTKAVYEADGKQVMVRHINNNKNESVLSGFDLQAIRASRRLELANNIVDWLFATNSISDGETNFSTKNGLKLATTPNPVVNTSNIVVNNENATDTYTDLYLIDLNGKKVYNVFSGTLQAGENHFNLSSNYVTVGKYFLVAETHLGKTFMSVIIDK